MKLEDGNLTVLRLANRSFEVIERPPGSSIARRRYQKRVVESRLKREATSLLIREFRSSSATRQT